MAGIDLLIKIHREFPGSLIFSQIDYPTYLICKQVTRILNPMEAVDNQSFKKTPNPKNSKRRRQHTKISYMSLVYI